MATPKSLMVIPASAANTTGVSFFQSLAENLKTTESQSHPTVDLFETATQFARQGAGNGNAVVHNFGQLSCAELYFGEMVMTEYSGNGQERGELKITMRDGRSIILKANVLAADSVRDAIRSCKP